MYVHRALLLVFLLLYVFTPSIQAWITADGVSWYRPFLVWAGIIVFVWWVQRRDRTGSYDV